MIIKWLWLQGWNMDFLIPWNERLDVSMLQIAVLNPPSPLYEFISSKHSPPPPPHPRDIAHLHLNTHRYPYQTHTHKQACTCTVHMPGDVYLHHTHPHVHTLTQTTVHTKCASRSPQTYNHYFQTLMDILTTSTGKLPFLCLRKEPSGSWHRLLAMKCDPWVKVKSSRSRVCTGPTSCKQNHTQVKVQYIRRPYTETQKWHSSWFPQLFSSPGVFTLIYTSRLTANWALAHFAPDRPLLFLTAWPQTTQ